MSLEPGHADPGPSSSPSPSPPTYTFRLATPADAPQVSALIGGTWARHFAYSVTPADLEHYLATSLSVAQIEADIASSSNQFLIASIPSFNAAQGGETVIAAGQLVLGTTEPCLTLPKPIELRRLYVDSNHHGSGLAAKLVSEIESLVAREGYQSIWLGVWEDNKRGLRFYEKMGFVSKGEHTFLVGESVRRDWVMEKAIGA